MTDEYGLMPWHFGGPEWLTHAEADAYIDHYKRKQREAKEASRSAQSPRR